MAGVIHGDAEPRCRECGGDDWQRCTNEKCERRFCAHMRGRIRHEGDFVDCPFCGEEQRL